MKIQSPYPAQYGFTPSNVYFLKAGPFTKIGRGLSVARRIKSCQTGNPFKVTARKWWPSQFAKSKEHELHYLLRRYRREGEWFELPNDLLSVIDQCQSVDDVLLSVKSWLTRAGFDL